MLPPPKRKLPASKSSVSKPIVPKVALPKPAANLPAPPGLNQVDSDSEDEGMVPASVRRKEKGKASVDLFGLGQSSHSYISVGSRLVLISRRRTHRIILENKDTSKHPNILRTNRSRFHTPPTNRNRPIPRILPTPKWSMGSLRNRILPFLLPPNQGR
jgi:hypothetical protein